MPSFNRAAVLMKGFLGDAVMATPLLEGLTTQLATVVVAPQNVGDLLGEAWRGRFVPYEGKGLAERRRAIRAAKPDVVFVLNRSFRSALAGWAAGVKFRVGHDVHQRGLLLTHRVPFDPLRHETEGALDLARAVGVNLPPAKPMLRVTEVEALRGRELLHGADVALQPGARHPYKRFPHESLVELVPRLRAAGLSPVLVGGAEEVDTADALAAAFPDIPSLVGKCSLRETMGVLAASRLAIGADTGVMHIAAAVGCPTVTVFGPTEFAMRWGHLYAPHQVLQATCEGMTSVDPAGIVAAGLLALSQADSFSARVVP